MLVNPLCCHSWLGQRMQFGRLKRREFITLAGAAVAAWPLAALAQQAGKDWRIGFFGPPLDVPSISAQYQAFLAQLRELGFSEGQNLIVEYRAL